MTDEGRAAIEAALDAYRRANVDGGRLEDLLPIAIKAYLAALPGWRLVPLELTERMHEKQYYGPVTSWTASWNEAPPPPGLSDEALAQSDLED